MALAKKSGPRHSKPARIDVKKTRGTAPASKHYVTIVRQIGGSEMCAIPKALQQQWGPLLPRTKLSCRIEGDKLIFERIRKPRLTLKERIAMCDLEAPLSKAEAEWMGDASAGEELL